MCNKTKKINSKKKEKELHVRFNEEEFMQIVEEQFIYGMGLPSLLKYPYFKGKLPHLRFSKIDQKQIQYEIGKMITNFRQISQKVNFGLLEGWNPNLEKIEEHLMFLSQFITGKDAH